MPDRRALPEPLREAFAERIEALFGLRFAVGREHALEQGVKRAGELLGEAEPARLLERLDAEEGAVLVTLADALTIGETYFFRDPQHFATLRSVLEGLGERENATLWSAGCASGAEAYTMAIVAREVFGPQAGRRVSIVATDLSEEALTHARAALFRPWALRGLDDATRERWFEREEGRFRVVEEARQLVSFRRHNLLDEDDPAVPRRVTVAFCRNVLVYFSPEGIHRAVRLLRSALADDGLLICGPSDPLLTAHGLAVDAAGGFLAYRKVPFGAASAPSGPTPRARARPPLPRRAHVPPERAAAVRPPSRAAPSPPAPSRADEGGRPAARLDEGGSLLDEARSRADAGDTAGALFLLDQLLRADRLVEEAYLLRAVLAQAEGRHGDALRDLRNALLLDDTLLYAHLVTAPSAAAEGDAALVRRSLRNARVGLAALEPQARMRGTPATAGELLATCFQMERTLLGGRAA